MTSVCISHAIATGIRLVPASNTSGNYLLVYTLCSVCRASSYPGFIMKIVCRYTRDEVCGIVYSLSAEKINRITSPAAFEYIQGSLFKLFNKKLLFFFS